MFLRLTVGATRWVAPTHQNLNWLYNVYRPEGDFAPSGQMGCIYSVLYSSSSASICVWASSSAFGASASGVAPEKMPLNVALMMF